MENNTKKCPMCAETIPLAASVCEYCGTRFEVSITGYCANCHQVRAADVNGCCKTCNGEVIDPRIESHMVEEPAPVGAPPIAVEQPLSRRLVSSKAWLWAIGAGLVLGVAGLAWGLNPKLAPAIMPASAITTVTTTATAFPSPVPTSTRTPISTPTTPVPVWVENFAQPILSAITDGFPGVQDDFGAGSFGWLKDYCKGSMKYVDEELVLTDCRVHRSKINWPDFVLEVDVRIQSGYWALHFRDSGNGGHEFRLDSNGEILIGFERRGMGTGYTDLGPIALSNNQANHVLMIAKGNSFAFFLNGQPLFYIENDVYRSGRCAFFVEEGSAVMDNFKIWDISKVPAP